MCKGELDIGHKTIDHRFNWSKGNKIGKDPGRHQFRDLFILKHLVNEEEWTFYLY